ncbi:MAG: hypothetical protein JXR84_08495 [Anaerolineae bacterium]|nr:hypothetical protein [Anaerolineae bacterium]
MTSRYAEDANYWMTTVHPAKSQAEIIELLDNFGATNYQISQGGTAGRGRNAIAWLIRFVWNDHSYRFLFTPLECRAPEKISSFGGKRRAHSDQAIYQMGRVAVHLTKAILTAAEMHPHALFGFMELPGTDAGGIPHTAAELDIAGIASALPVPTALILTPPEEA